MKHYIDKDAVVMEIKRQILAIDNMPKITDTQISVLSGDKVILTKLLSFIDNLEVKEVDLEKESELIANDIMIGVQSNKYHTCVYNTARFDFNHSHLMLAARKGIELGLKAAQKGE